jgi:20S proteasome alpha/beta subunit
MTLIAAFRCTDGAIICADSQETVGHHRVSVQKIAPFDIGKLRVAIAGSGENGDLLDAFIEELRQELEAKPVADLNQLKTDIQDYLLAFMKDEASLYPKDQRAMRFIIAARLAEELPTPPAINVLGLGEARVWETRSSRLVPLKKYALVGWDEELYRRAVERLFRNPLTISQAIPLAMYVFALAEDTSNYVRGPISVAVVTSNSPILIENVEAIEEFETMTETYARALEDMLLACADTAMRKEDFADKFAAFSETIFRLRRDYFKAAHIRETYGFLTGRWPGTPYRRLPRYTVRTVLVNGTVEAREDQAATEKFHERLKQMREQVKNTVGELDIEQIKTSVSGTLTDAGNKA